MQCDDSPQEGVIRIPFERLSVDVLEAIIEEYVMREGTDYGAYDYSLDDKKAQVMAQVRRGVAVILFDPMAESCHLVMADQLPPNL